MQIVYDKNWAVKNEEIPEIYKFYGDFWKFLKATYKADCSDAYCSYIIETGNILVKKYKGTAAEMISKLFVLGYIKNMNETMKGMNVNEKM